MKGQIAAVLFVVLMRYSICQAARPRHVQQNRLGYPHTRELPEDAEARKKERDTPSPTDFPTVSPTVSPTPMPSASPTRRRKQNDKNKDVETSRPSPSPTPREQEEENDNNGQDEIEETPEPTDFEETPEPTRNPTNYPTSEPTMTPTQSPSVSPSLSPTASPSVSPTEAPSTVPSASPTGVPSFQPSSMPSSAPSIVKYKVVLNDFNVLLTSSKEINLFLLDQALEAYLLEEMDFSSLIRMELTVIEGDSTISKDGYVISTSVRFSGLATFEGILPPLGDIRAEQARLLEAYQNVGVTLGDYAAFEGVSVESVSFSRIDSSEPFKEKKILGGLGNKGLGILVGIVCICVLWVVGIVLIVRLQKTKNTHKKLKNEMEEKKKKKKKKKEDDAAKGCGSLVSGPVFLGNQDSVQPSAVRPDEISIHYTYSLDEDEAYLTMDEELRTYTDFSAARR